MLFDDMEDRISPLLKWIFAGVGAAAGWHYAQTQGSSIPLSCIVAGMAAGFCALALTFFGLRLLRAVLIVIGLFFIVNFAVLIPFGYGNHWLGFLDVGRSALHWLQARDWPRPRF